MRLSTFAALAALGLTAATPASAEPRGELTTGVEYQEGDYFTGERVEILSVQNAFRLDAGGAFFSVSLPWHRIAAPGNVVGGGGPLGLPIILDPTQPATREVRSGIGDLRVGAGYTMRLPASLDLTLTGQLKLPTASASRGIGTGEADVAVGGEASRSFGAVTPFVAVGYTMPGEPAAYTLQDSLSARGGIAVQIAPGVRGNVAYGYAESLNPSLPAERQISTGLNTALSRSLSLGIYGSAGLSRGSADIGAGVSLGIKAF